MIVVTVIFFASRRRHTRFALVAGVQTCALPIWPEEGNWWYDTGELVRLLALAPTEARAVARADRTNRLLERLQRHHRRVDSVLYDGGRYTAVVYEDRKSTRLNSSH